MAIKLLSESTINRIAAGEVIERPASVVKELVENAIDAGGTKIDIILEQAGKNLIIVSDNGAGMSDTELEMAIERHTTSKLDENDFLNIHTFGFRGEALPSIGAISKMSISSKKHGNNKAYQIKLIGGSEKQISPSIHNEGTKVEIRDLFYATPARLKFLRTDKTELAASVDIIKKIALAHPKISINLTHDNKNIIKVKEQHQDSVSSLKQRIIDILGQDFIKNSTCIDFKTPELIIYGYTSIPTFNRASGEDQYLFINNRPVKDKLLQIALRIAYKDYLTRDRHPLCVIFLQINPQLVDVNAHPTKAEVRFHNPNNIRDLLISAINDTLKNKSHSTSTTIADSTLQLFKNPFIEKTNNEIPDNTNIKVTEKITGYNNNKSQIFKKPQLLNNNTQKLIDTLPHAKIEPEIAKHLSQNYSANYRLGAAKAQLHANYIISQADDSIIITDQHAAHERLGYEKIKKSIAKEGLIKQRLLIPEIVELPDKKRADLLYENKEQLSKLGLSLEKFGEKSMIVSETPSLLGDINVEQLIHDLADQLLDFGSSISLIELIEHVTETYACHYSIRAGRRLSTEEMNTLLRQMENTPFSDQCNHGRPTYIELKLKDIERLFGRK